MKGLQFFTYEPTTNIDAMDFAKKLSKFDLFIALIC